MHECEDVNQIIPFNSVKCFHDIHLNDTATWATRFLVGLNKVMHEEYVILNASPLYKS